MAPVDFVLLASLVGSFALLVTVHVALIAGLTARHPRWRGAVAFLVPPLAPYWGMEEGMKRRAALWLVALCVYVVARIAVSF
ncbi:MAG: hypothetical protein KC776_35135 [Myxococcales bacterium]|nr:hypothetical protein [Myxococcales bacterium]MCB9578811.1 hypothetical protein [Polyangiaceae bacterium]